MTTGTFSQRERSALCDLLVELGPDVPTLCEGWRSADLAAHLVVRDHRPDAVPGMVLRLAPFGPWTDRVCERVRDTSAWGDLVQRVRSGPPALLRPLDRYINSVEYFVHHEDLRRAQPGWEPRRLGPDEEDLLWRRLRLMGRMARSGAASMEAPGRPPLVLSKTGTGPVVMGPVGELTLWALGRRTAVSVDVVYRP